MVNIKRLRKMTLNLHEKPKMVWKRMRLSIYGFKNTSKA